MDESTQDWRNNPGAKEHVASLLDESGVPLEARVARICQRLVTIYNGHNDMHASAAPLVYGKVASDQPLREIDQLVTLYQEFEISEGMGIQLALNVPIAAKYRRGARVFGVDVDGATVSSGAIPISGSLSRSTLIRQYVAPQLPAYMTSDSLRRLAVLLFKDDKQTPWKVSDENLIYKATAGLYDFIREAASEHFDASSAERAIDEGLLDEFHSYLQETRYSPEYVARRWIREIAMDKANEYFRKRTGNRALYDMIDLYCPLVCIDAP